MKKLIIFVCLTVVVNCMVAQTLAQKAQAMLQQAQSDSIAVKGENDVLYSKNELNHLAKGELTNGRIVKVSACKRANNANPLPALKNFHDGLKALGIELIIVPVPPKLAAMPGANCQELEAMKYLRDYYQELRKQGLNILDISEKFPRPAASLYCRTDAHWSPAGIDLTADLLAQMIPLRGKTAFSMQKRTQKVIGDLARSCNSNAAEELTYNEVAGNALSEDSPVLLIGDSHCLIFSVGGDMLTKNAGLAEKLAVKLQMPIDRIAVRGSAATAVRVNCYRKAARNKAWLKNKKYVIYCFAAREFTESGTGWAKVPVMKK